MTSMELAYFRDIEIHISFGLSREEAEKVVKVKYENYITGTPEKPVIFATSSSTGYSSRGVRVDRVNHFLPVDMEGRVVPSPSDAVIFRGELRHKENMARCSGCGTFHPICDLKGGICGGCQVGKFVVKGVEVAAKVTLGLMLLPIVMLIEADKEGK